jgi:hypothetical protein
VDQGGAEADEQANRDRVLRLARELHGPTIASYRRQLRTIILAVMLGIFVALVTRQVALAVLTTAAVSAAGSTFAWSWLRRAEDRRVFEILRDHDDYERVEWKADNDGTPRPRGPDAARRWLDANAGRPGTAVVLADLGRLDAAREALEGEVETGPEDVFSREVDRRCFELYAGGRPDTSDLHDRWAALPDGAKRRHLRECLALLDAQVAIADGHAPWPVVAAAGPEIGAVASSMTSGWFALTIAVVCLAATGVVGIAGAFIAR